MNEPPFLRSDHKMEPDTCSIAFKEWAGVCLALGTGRQILILRKGGIAESGGIFLPEHDRFWLYPTFVHQATQGLKPDTPLPVQADPAKVELRYFANVDWCQRLNDFKVFSSLENEHVWATETIRQRFHYKSDGLWLICVRIMVLSEPRTIEVLPEYQGCHTWVPLHEPVTTEKSHPVLDDEAFRDRSNGLRSSINSDEPTACG